MLERDQKLSHYRLAEPIGKGGMGEVWRAVDERLDRDVAIKVLPEALAQDPGRLERFSREAKLLASLNHPGIATIHDVNTHDGMPYLVMELVPGADLAGELERGPLPLDEALRVAVEIAAAIEAAHGQGVIHRDLKPANVKRLPDGKVKVLDFGLAKAVGPEPTSGETDLALSPTMTSAGTVAGMILGTAAYMSPEQARGKPIDKRTDIWSFGVLLFELLTGDNPFRGETVADSVGAIMHRDPDLSLLPEQTPAAARRVLRRCLQRERGRRLHDIADARIELEEAIADPDGDVVSTPATVERVVEAPASRLPWVAMAVLIPLAAVLTWWIVGRDAAVPPEPTRRFRLLADLDIDAVELSPDGKRIAFVSGNDLQVRSLDSVEPRVIATSEEPFASIFWSPDSQSVGMVRAAGISRVDLSGGAPRTVFGEDGNSIIEHAAWGDDGFIYLTQFQGGIQRIPAGGGAIETVYPAPETVIDFHGIAVLPDGGGVVTLPHFQSDPGPDAVHVFTADGEAREVYKSDAPIDGLALSPTGHLVFHRPENPRGLWALPFSTDDLTVTGEPFLIVPDLRRASFSRAGDMVYTPNSMQDGRRKRLAVFTDDQGTVRRRLSLPIYEPRSYALSSDGRRIAVIARGVGQAPANRVALWVIDVIRETALPISEDAIVPGPLNWDAEGTRIAYLRSAESGPLTVLEAVRSDGSGQPEALLTADMTFFTALDPSWSKVLAVTGKIADPSGVSIGIQDVGSPEGLEPLIDTHQQDIAPQVHPSGRWMSFHVGSVAEMSLSVAPFPSADGQWTVAAGVANHAWSPDGDTLYYTINDGDATRVLSVSFDGEGERPILGAPEELFTVPGTGMGGLAVADGQFLFLLDAEPIDGEPKPDASGIVLVENWLTSP